MDFSLIRTYNLETNMEPDCDQQMAFLLTRKPVACSNDNVGTRESPRTRERSIWPIKVTTGTAAIQKKDHADRF